MCELRNLADKGGRRSGIDRRQFQYDGCIPERRRGEERRSGMDRRTRDRRQEDSALGV